MQTIAVGDTSSASNPVLDFYVRRRGFLVDPMAAEFQVFRGAEQVWPATLGQRAPIDVEDDRVSLGRFAAPWSAVGATPGAHELRAFVTVDGTARTLRQPFEVVSATAPRVLTYATIQDLRDEGVTSEQASDARIRLALGTATATVERLTRQWFEPRPMTLVLDGTGRNALELRVPVAAVAEVRIDGVAVPAGDLVIYARHLDGMLSPDDRRAPSVGLRGGRFPRGQQNVEVDGVFGFTEALGSGFDVGATPWLIRHVTKLLAMRELEQLTSPDRAAARNGHRVIEEQTRDQRYVLAPMQGSTFMGATGDPEIDGILVLFRAPIGIGSV